MSCLASFATEIQLWKARIWRKNVLELSKIFALYSKKGTDQRRHSLWNAIFSVLRLRGKLTFWTCLVQWFDIKILLSWLEIRSLHRLENEACDKYRQLSQTYYRITIRTKFPHFKIANTFDHEGRSWCRIILPSPKIASCIRMEKIEQTSLPYELIKNQ